MRDRGARFGTLRIVSNAPGAGGQPLLRTQSRFLNDGRQVFVKISYLFRY